MVDSDRRSTLLDAYENAAVIVSGIAADELGHHPTPCPKYDVAGLIDHLGHAGVLSARRLRCRRDAADLRQNRKPLLPRPTELFRKPQQRPQPP